MRIVVRAAAAIAIFLYTFLLVYWMFVGFGRQARRGGEMMYNLMPLSTIKNYFIYFDHYSFTTWLINIGGNVLVFIPFGVCLPLAFGWGFKKMMINFIVFISTLEVLQMVTRRGSLDVDDVLLNSLGAAIGYGVYKLVFGTRFIPQKTGHSRKA
ncbi:VanZ family protein [Paenibacillus sp. NPDC058174]|uniref:VanZ family protein n=1 Tax=Paenibacillus sp. NPDC058174 TaxID=3346366 RepID=UPI0036DC8BD1